MPWSYTTVNLDVVFNYNFECNRFKMINFKTILKISVYFLKFNRLNFKKF